MQYDCLYKDKQKIKKHCKNFEMEKRTMDF